MWTSSVSFELLCQRGRWNVEYFCAPTDARIENPNSRLVPLGSIVDERRETVDPLLLGDIQVCFIGLEHIQSVTGELVDFQPRLAKSIRSRAKVFKSGDVLFGRLRPYLNKVWVAQGEVSEGICSTEFLVLVPKKDRVLPLVLRYLLSSHYVQRHALRLQTGAALPRMNLDDLLAIPLPLPSMHKQRKLEKQLARQFQRLRELRLEIESMPASILEEFLKEVEAD